MSSSIELVDGVRAEIFAVHPVKEGSEVWRVTIKFMSDQPEANKLIKEYYVWVTGEYLEDKARMDANTDSAQEFALSLVKKRFEESGKQVPIENGISCSNKEGIIIVNPKEFIHPQEK